MNLAELDAAVSTLSVKSGLTPAYMVIPQDLFDQIFCAFRNGLVHQSSWMGFCPQAIGRSDRVYVRWTRPRLPAYRELVPLGLDTAMEEK